MKFILRATRPLLLTIAVAGVLLSGALGVGAQAASATPRGALLPPVEGEVIVRFRAGADILRKHALAAGARGETVHSAIDGRARSLGERVGRPLAAGAAISERTQVVRASGIDAAALARQLAADPEVEFAVPNGRKRRLTAPNDPLYPESATELRTNGITDQRGPASGQWYLRAPDATLRSAVDIEAAWTKLGSRGTANVVVALLDTGVRFEHPDLRKLADGGRLLDGYDFVSDATVANDGDGRDGDPSDPGDWVSLTDTRTSTFSDCEVAPSSWHGTSTASLVGAIADNAIGMSGAAPGVRVLPVRVLGKCYGTDSDIQAAMRWAAGLSVPGMPSNPNPAKVINMSLGSPDTCGSYQAVVDEIVANGVMIVAAAGNSAGGPVGSPANCRGVVAVGGLRHAGTKVGFSDLGPEIAISAPAGNCVNITDGTPCLYPILAATNTGERGPQTSTWSDSYNITVGTSFASPLVAAVAGLMYSQDPSLSVSGLRGGLRATSRPFPTDGADNGPDDPTPVTQCHAPISGTPQLQCYCTTALCGAGMADAGKALTSVIEGVAARIDFDPALAVVGGGLVLDSGLSAAVTNSSLVGWAWSIVPGGSATAQFIGATSGPTATLTATTTGTVKVRLTVVGAEGGQSSTEATVTMQVRPPADGAGGGGGGGATSTAWLSLLAVAVLALRGRREPI